MHQILALGESRESAKKILVTGVPRSGTTVIGQLLAMAPRSSYVWEPFNYKFNSLVTEPYPYCDTRTSPPEVIRHYRQITGRILEGRLLPGTLLRFEEDNRPKRILKTFGVSWPRLHYLGYWLRRGLWPIEMLVVKDPIALFLARFLIEEYKFTVVVTVRHPCAVLESRLRRRWMFNFDWWLDRDELRSSALREITTDELDAARADVAANSALHWRSCYGYLMEVAQQFPTSVVFVRNEDFLLNPCQTIHTLCNRARITVTRSMLHRAAKLTTGSTADQSTSRLSKTSPLDPVNALTKWRERLNAELIATTIRVVGETGKRFYPIEMKGFDPNAGR